MPQSKSKGGTTNEKAELITKVSEQPTEPNFRQRQHSESSSLEQ